MFDGFINISNHYENLDRFYIRISILKAIKKSLPLFSGKLLDAGCGQMPYKEYILKNSEVKEYVGLDIENALDYNKDVKPDYTWNGLIMPFEDNSFDCCMATEVLEHCPDPEIFLNECNRVLKPGGIMIFTVPFLWNLHEVPHDEYRYTPFSIERHLRNCRFKEIELEATGGWHASMAQMLGLWVRRSPMSKRRRKVFSIMLKPVIKKLIKYDKYSTVTFKEGQMITGIYGAAKKTNES